MTFRRLLALTVCALGATALPATASAASGGTGSLLPTVKRTLTAPATTTATCASAPATGAGLATASYTAPLAGYLTVRLAGNGDWDLLLRDAAGRNGQASQSFGGDEVVQTWIAAGERVTAVGCRHAGAARRATIAFQFADVKPPVSETASLVRVKAGLAKQAQLDALGLDVTESRSANWADVIVNGADDLAKLSDFDASFKTRVDDLAAFDRTALRSSRAARASTLPSGRTEYRTYEDIQTELKKLVTDNGDMVRPVVFGKSYQGREITGIEISKNVKADDGRPVYFLMGVHHAREWPSAEMVMEYAQLLVKSKSDPRIAKILAGSRVVLLPVVNVDGYVSSRSFPVSVADSTGDGNAQTGESVAPPGGVGAYRRKNCNNEDDNPSTPCEAAHGVDNNRNYGNLWGGAGSSSDITSQSYHGSAPRSELETQAVYKYATTHHVTTLISLHTIAGLVLRPPGLAAGGKAPDEVALKALGDAMGDATGYTSQYSFQLYDTAGTTEDDTYAATGGFGYTIEIGPPDGLFHGPYDTNVVKEWDGTSELAKGRGGLREALLKANETAIAPASHAQLKGVSIPGNVIRLHKDFETKTSDYCKQGVEPVVTLPIPIPSEATCANGVQKAITLKDNVDFKTTIPATGQFDYQIGQSTRPFVNGGATTTTETVIAPPIKSFTGGPGAPNGTVDHEFTIPADFPAADKAHVDLTLGSGVEDYDLEVFIKEGDTLKSVGTSGNSPGENEHVSLETVTPGATYVARVTYFAAVTGNYTIDVKRVEVKTETTTGHKEAYTLTCETPAGKVLETLQFVIDRNQEVNVRIGCGVTPSTDAAGNPLNTSTTCTLPNTAPTFGCQPVPTGAPTTPLAPSTKLKVKLRRDGRQNIRKLRKRHYLTVFCKLNLPGTCAVTAKYKGKKLGRRTVTLKKPGKKLVKIKITKKAVKRFKVGQGVRLSAVAKTPGQPAAKSALTVRPRRAR